MFSCSFAVTNGTTEIPSASVHANDFDTFAGYCTMPKLVHEEEHGPIGVRKVHVRVFPTIV